MKRNPLTLLALPLLALLPSCLGPFNASRGVLNWNAELHENDAVCEVVFIGLNIIPVYPLVLLGDAIIFNSVEYWTGENPIDDPGPFPGGFGKEAEASGDADD